VTNIQLTIFVFLDRLGSWITIPFYKGSYMNQAVQRDDIRKKVRHIGWWKVGLIILLITEMKLTTLKKR
jgi:hypothetical protein